MIRLIAIAALLAVAACQPLQEGAGGATINASCMMSADLATPPSAGSRVSCVTIITSGATTNTPTSNASATIPVSAAGGLPIP